MRGRMSEGESYAPPAGLDETRVGGPAGEVIASKNPSFAVGDKVVGMLGWAEMGVSDGGTLRKVDTSQVPLQAYLGVAGMPGMTAWYGVNQILAPKPGETVLVSAASGAVGSVAGQLARLKGCRVVGIAGGKEKCAYVVKELGFDACVDYKAGHLAADLAAATPGGVDAVFENVGGEVLDATLARMNAFGRIAVCGLIAGYNGEDVPIYNFGSVLTNRLAVRGFIVSEHMEFWAQGLAELATLIAGGKLKYRETVAQNLANAPEAFIGLLKGKNFGKQLVKLT
jgi:NADPH-dependent curcumin reductase CurA